MIFGLIVLIIGILLLLQTLGLITYDVWSIFWPMIVILIGLKIMAKKGKHHWGCCGGDHEHHEHK